MRERVGDNLEFSVRIDVFHKNSEDGGSQRLAFPLLESASIDVPYNMQAAPLVSVHNPKGCLVTRRQDTNLRHFIDTSTPVEMPVVAQIVPVRVPGLGRHLSRQQEQRGYPEVALHAYRSFNSDRIEKISLFARIASSPSETVRW